MNHLHEFGASTGGSTPSLTVDGDVFSFTVPPLPISGELICGADVKVHAAVTACGFATCDDQIDVPIDEYDLFEFTVWMSDEEIPGSRTFSVRPAP